MSLRFSLLAGAALVLAPSVAAQNALSGPVDVAPYVAPVSSDFGGISLTQNINTDEVTQGMVACANGDGGYTTDNGYWRVFDLSQENIGGAFAVTDVNVGVNPPASSALDSLRMNIYTLPEGTDVSTSFPAADLTLVASSDFFTADDPDETGDPVILNVAVVGVVPQDALMAVQLSIPTGNPAESGDAEATDVRAGANLDGETGPTYLSSEACGITDPTATGAIGGGFDGGFVLVVNGAISTASEDGLVGRKVSIGSAQPNPVADAAKVPFTLEASSVVRVTVYDLLGREVAELANRSYSAGSHELTLDATDLPAGTYVVRLAAQDAVVTQTVTVSR